MRASLSGSAGFAELAFVNPAQTVSPVRFAVLPAAPTHPTETTPSAIESLFRLPSISSEAKKRAARSSRLAENHARRTGLFRSRISPARSVGSPNVKLQSSSPVQPFTSAMSASNSASTSFWMKLPHLKQRPRTPPNREQLYSRPPPSGALQLVWGGCPLAPSFRGRDQLSAASIPTDRRGDSARLPRDRPPNKRLQLTLVWGGCPLAPPF